jgi:hypothetical protein
VNGEKKKKVWIITDKRTNLNDLMEMPLKEEICRG